MKMLNETVKHERIPSLDGLRAISILIVLGYHLLWTYQFKNDDVRIWKVILSGDFGVHIFFVISGFLITGILLREEKAQGKIDISKFYLKRIFRIFPAYYFYLLVVYILNTFLVSDLEVFSMIIPLTYTTGL